MNIKLLGAFAAVALLAACATTRRDGDVDRQRRRNDHRAGARQRGRSCRQRRRPRLLRFQRLVPEHRRHDGPYRIRRVGCRNTPRSRCWWPAIAIPARTEEYNLALGQRRADAARDYLVAQGVDGSRIQTISYGKDSPGRDGRRRRLLFPGPQRHHLRARPQTRRKAPARPPRRSRKPFPSRTAPRISDDNGGQCGCPPFFFRMRHQTPASPGLARLSS